MPLHKGIKMTIVSQAEFHVHPEFAPPESSQFTRSPSARGGGAVHIDSSQPFVVSKESKADRILGRQSAVSVYIPSVPGARFWLRYSINEEAAQEAPWYFFKLSMNGSNIASWGTNSKGAESAQVMRGLFEPTNRYNYRHEGTTYKCMGTETRPFFFAKEGEAKSAAEDGGMIQVQVYRAAGRKRKMPEPVDWKSQERYGIVMPSSGLIDNPEDAKFYDWRLIDPKDSPLCVFQFHYRSWDSLQTLQLIPPGYPRKLLPSSASILSFHGLSRELQEKLRESESDGETLDIEAAAGDRSSIDSQESDDPFLSPVFDNDSGEPLMTHDLENAFIVPENAPLYPDCRIDSPITDKLASAIVDKPTSPETRHWKDRPLPQIPSRRSSLKHLRRHSRKTSSTSTSPSITSSLRSYADRDTLSPEPEVGTADIALLTQHSSPAFDNQDPSVSEDEYSHSPDKHFNSPTQNDNLQPRTPPSKRSFLSRSFRRSASKKNKIITDSPGPTNRPGVTPPPILLPNVTVRKSRNSPPKVPLPQTPLRSTKKQLPISKLRTKDVDDESLMENTTKLSEAEWMCRTPSPIKKTSTPLKQPSVLSERLISSPSIPARNPARKIVREGSGQLLDMGISGNRTENRKIVREGSGQLLDLGMSLSASKEANENRRDGNGSISSLRNLEGNGKASLRKKMTGWYSKDKVRAGETVDENQGGDLRGRPGVEEHGTRMGEMGGNWI